MMAFDWSHLVIPLISAGFMRICRYKQYPRERYSCKKYSCLYVSSDDEKDDTDRPMAKTNMSSEILMKQILASLVQSRMSDSIISCLKRLAKKQRVLLAKKAAKITPRAISKTRNCSRGQNRDGSSGANVFQTVEDVWESYLDRVSRSFFRPREATLEDVTDEDKPMRPYQGVPLTPKNNADMMRIYEVSWKAAMTLGQSMGHL